VKKLAKGMGHNYYGEPVGPNDLLYIFPSWSWEQGHVLSSSVLDPCHVWGTSKSWPPGNSARVVLVSRLPDSPDRSQQTLRGHSNGFYTFGFLLVSFIENVNKFQNPFRRPVATTLFMIGTLITIWYWVPHFIDSSLTLAFLNYL